MIEPYFVYTVHCDAHFLEEAIILVKLDVIEVAYADCPLLAVFLANCDCAHVGVFESNGESRHIIRSRVLRMLRMQAGVRLNRMKVKTAGAETF